MNNNAISLAARLSASAISVRCQKTNKKLFSVRLDSYGGVKKVSIEKDELAVWFADMKIRVYDSSGDITKEIGYTNLEEKRAFKQDKQLRKKQFESREANERFNDQYKKRAS